jgi:ribosome-associated heat shock protein Hsp15
MYRNLTPREELEKLDLTSIGGYEFRQRGAGRPTKRERRLIDRLKKK